MILCEKKNINTIHQIKKLFYDFDHSIKEYQKSKMFKNLNFLSYDEYIKINNKKKISENI